MILVDCSVGISGDMLVSALVDLGARKEELDGVVGVIQKVTGKRGRVVVGEAVRGGIAAKRVVLQAQDFEQLSAEKLQEYMKLCLEGLGMERRYSRLAFEALEILISCEERVHEEERGNLALHELGSVDTLFDLLSFASLAQELSLLDSEVVASPPNLGSGKVGFSHGELPVPTPLAQQIVSSHDIPVTMRYSGELSTPTGLALLASLAPRFLTELSVPFKPARVGRGAGSRELDDAPNILSITMAERLTGYREDRVTVLETNLDDCTGEVLGYLIEKLMDEGALDVQLIPGITKKNRPSYILCVLCREEHVEGLISTIFLETGTLGIRISRKEMRVLREREVREVEVEFKGEIKTVRVKVSRSVRGEVASLKPEYEDCSRIAEELGLPLREVLNEVTLAASRALP